MAFKKSKKQRTGLLIGVIGILIIGYTLLTNNLHWPWVLISAVLIIGGSIFWYIKK